MNLDSAILSHIVTCSPKCFYKLFVHVFLVYVHIQSVPRKGFGSARSAVSDTKYTINLSLCTQTAVPKFLTPFRGTHYVTISSVHKTNSDQLYNLHITKISKSLNYNLSIIYA